MHFVGKWIRNTLWLLFGLIVFLFLIGMMKYGGFTQYVSFLNNRDWSQARSGSITSIFWERSTDSIESRDSTGSVDAEKAIFTGTQDALFSGAEMDDAQDEFDGYFQEIENSTESTGSTDSMVSGEEIEEDGFGFQVPEESTGYIKENKDHMIELMKQREIRDEIAE